MQDRSRQLDEDLLRRTAGPYIRIRFDCAESHDKHDRSSFDSRPEQALRRAALLCLSGEQLRRNGGRMPRYRALT